MFTASLIPIRYLARLVEPFRAHVHPPPPSPSEPRNASERADLLHCRYLLNGNILAARTFLSQLVSQFASTRGDFVSPLHPSPIPVGKPVNGHQDEVILTKDPLVNFAQLAVRTCQRAQGDKNKAVREAWVRLCGTYQSKGGLLAAKEVRRVSTGSPSLSVALFK